MKLFRRLWFKILMLLTCLVSVAVMLIAIKCKNIADKNGFYDFPAEYIFIDDTQCAQQAYSLYNLLNISQYFYNEEDLFLQAEKLILQLNSKNIHVIYDIYIPSRGKLINASAFGELYNTWEKKEYSFYTNERFFEAVASSAVPNQDNANQFFITLNQTPLEIVRNNQAYFTSAYELKKTIGIEQYNALEKTRIITVGEYDYYTDSRSVEFTGLKPIFTGDDCRIIIRRYADNTYYEDNLALGISQNRLLYGLYEIRDYIIPIMIASAIIGALSLIFLLCICGKRANQDGIVLNAIDRIPNDIFILGILCAAILWIGIIDLLFRSGLISGYEGILIYYGLFVTVLILMLSQMTRIKARCFFKSMLTVKVLKKLLVLGKRLVRIIPMATGCFIALGIVEIVNLITIYIASSVSGLMLFLPLAAGINILFVMLMILYISSLLKLEKILFDIADGKLGSKIDDDVVALLLGREVAIVNRIGDSLESAVAERTKSERMKTELITNVSHDLKTPITSIISYVDLLKKEDIANENAKSYIEVLDRQSERLRNLASDLIEASKANTGNLEVSLKELQLHDFFIQVLAEYEDKFLSRSLKLIYQNDCQDAAITADERHLFRAVDNLLQNVYKYAMEGSRVYLSITSDINLIRIELKNMSGVELNISADELMERFVRGDKSRNTEGSGLGLAISKSLLELMGYKLEISVDGDLFKAIIIIEKANNV